MRLWSSLGVILLGLLLIGGGLLFGVFRASFGEHLGPGEVTRARVPPAQVEARREQRLQTSRALRGFVESDAKQILFGDLHVHTSLSGDAFQFALPLIQGEGVHPPADACDFARFCSALDFWAITDHAEQISPRHWRETIDSVRRCDAVAGDRADPDLVSFLGWEWTQIGVTPETHYGHRNVILRHLDAANVPARPIGSGGGGQVAGRVRPPLMARVVPLLVDSKNRRSYFDLARYQEDLLALDTCEVGVNVHDLPADCLEEAATPQVLFEKLDQWGHDALVIPHGTAWGQYTPVGADLRKDLARPQHDPARQTLIEVYSGHGSSEQYRSWRHADRDAAGEPSCPAPSLDFVPCCWRAGELIAERCGDIPEQECNARVRAAQRNYLALGVDAMASVAGATLEEWRGCGYDRSVFAPAFHLRPGGTVQYSLALSDFTDPNAPLRFRWGFVGSSDTHRARPGNGYKELDRFATTEAIGVRDARTFRALRLGAASDRPRSPESLSPEAALRGLPFIARPEVERQSSYFLTGGLAAVHATGRDRGAIWQALQRREVYATSGPKILLWFDLLNGPDGRAVMGSEVAIGEAPWFRVRAAGAFEQKPGCPEHVTGALSAERLQWICRGECDHPGERRHVITRIEIVRILPQARPDEPVDPLIEDPWLVLACDGGADGCVIDFRDPEYAGLGREVVYYARAIQEPTPAINAAAERCEYDDEGRCVRARPCYGDYRTPSEDDCTSPLEERAWSSPIYLRPPG